MIKIKKADLEGAKFEMLERLFKAIKK